MSRKLIGLSVAGLLAAVAAVGALVLDPIGTAAEEGGVYVQFGMPAESGGIERDRNSQGFLTVNAGTPVVFWNRSGWGHQVAVYDKDLAKNGSGPTTTLLDVTLPTSGVYIDDPVGRLALGPSPSEYGCGPNFCPVLTKGVIDLTYTFRTPGIYMVICNVAPHLTNVGQATWVNVK